MMLSDIVLTCRQTDGAGRADSIVLSVGDPATVTCLGAVGGDYCTLCTVFVAG